MNGDYRGEYVGIIRPNCKWGTVQVDAEQLVGNR
jgi:hypothetical protein